MLFTINKVQKPMDSDNKLQAAAALLRQSQMQTVEPVWPNAMHRIRVSNKRQ